MRAGTPGAAEWLADAGKDLRALYLDGRQRTRVQTQQVKDRRCHLGCLHPGMHPRMRNHPGRVDEQRHVSVTRVIATVFGDLAPARVYDADLDAPEHIRVAR